MDKLKLSEMELALGELENTGAILVNSVELSDEFHIERLRKFIPSLTKKIQEGISELTVELERLRLETTNFPA